MKMRNVVFAGILGLSFFAGAAQAAQYVVVEARGVNLKVGAIVDPTKPLVLKQGQHLTLISDSGQTIKLDGPYEKAPIAAQGVQLAAAFGALASNNNGRLGEIGTTRATGKVTLPKPWLLDAVHPGSECLLEGQQPVLWRPAGDDAADVAIMPADRSWKAQADWPRGDTELPMKKDMGVHGDASYFVSVNGNETAISISTVPASLANDQMRAAWMLQKGCGPQAEALLRASR
ncbi:MAG: hypothetical protein JSR55_01965 [Proteobacteria bacterium]|nr:hypothetical protein [Pseudomonadota bacterium]